MEIKANEFRQVDRRRTFSTTIILPFLVFILPGALVHAREFGGSGGANRPGDEPFSCIPSGDHNSITAALKDAGSSAVLCPNAVFELGDTVFFTANDQSIYTEGFPTDDTRALLRVVGDGMAIAVSGEHYNRVSLKNVIIDGNRPQLGLAPGALLNFGRGILDTEVEGQTIEWVKAYEPRGWTVLYFGGICDGAIARNNEIGPAGRAEYVLADGISVECPNSVVEHNTIVDATDGGIVIFQSPGSVIANNTIRSDSRVSFYGISMVDYYPLEGDFTGTRVADNVLDASGAMMRSGISMGPYVGCGTEDASAPRSRGAVVSGNTLTGDYMVYGFVVSGVENWTLTGNVDLSTHLVPDRYWDCHGLPVDLPSGFQYNAVTSSGNFQPEFEASVLGGSADMFPSYSVASAECMTDLLGADVFEDIIAGNRGDIWEAMENAPNGERIDQCFSAYQPPDVSGLSGKVGIGVLPCSPLCAKLRGMNDSDDAASLERAEFLVNDFPVVCVGLPVSLGPWEETSCTIEDFIVPGFNGLSYFGLPGLTDVIFFTYPFESIAVEPDETPFTDAVVPNLSQNYPNPFSTPTVIDYTVPAGPGVRVLLSIYDLRGRLVRVLVDADEQPGRHTVRWDGRDLRGRMVGSGVYFYRIDAGKWTRSRKMIVLR